MGVVKRIRKRGATITVESHAEILFMPGGSINSWMAKFTGQLRSRTIKNAPTNKRPRWGHYGKPLKATIVSARPRFWGNGRDKQRVYTAVGSTAPHAYYVDQGTGVYGGRGPYEAKVLPPYQWGSASLYEHTWRPGGIGTRKVAPVMIQGQEPKFFFDESLRETMHHMRLSAFQVPTSPKITDALGSKATGLEGFLGNTLGDEGFIASLREWRRWRDDAWDRGEGLGRGGGIGSKAHAKYVEQAGIAKQTAKKKAAAKPAQKAAGKSAQKAKVIKKPVERTHKSTAQEIHNKERIVAQQAERKRLRVFIESKFPGSKIKYDTFDLYHVGNQFKWNIIVTVNGRVHRYTVPSGIRP